MLYVLDLYTHARVRTRIRISGNRNLPKVKEVDFMVFQEMGHIKCNPNN